MERGGQAPEPADRGGAGLSRRTDRPQVPRRQRGYYIGGRDDDGYFVPDPEQHYGGPEQANGDEGGDDRDYFVLAGEQNGDEGGGDRDYFALTAEQNGDDSGYFAPPPERVHGGAGCFVRNAPAPFRVPHPVESAILEDALARAPGPVGDMIQATRAPGPDGNMTRATRRLPALVET